MLNAIVIDALLIIAFIAASISTVTDFWHGKIYNIMIIILAFIGFPFVITLYGFFHRDVFLYYLLNFIISIILNLLFYASKIWAAGDAKLMALLIFLLPYCCYYGNEGMWFPAIYIFIAIFSLAFLYVVLESLFLSILNYKMLKTRISSIHVSLSRTVDFLIMILAGMLLAGFLSNCYSYILGNIYAKNNYLFIVLNFFCITLFYSIVKRKYMEYAIIIEIFLYALFVISTKANIANIMSIRLSSVLMAGTIIIIRFVADTYNYKEIRAAEAKTGMVLSYASAMFLTSCKKEMIILTDETTKTRITANQAQAIKDWALTRKDDPHIYIVRLMPFSIFILLGLILYLIVGVIY